MIPVKENGKNLNVKGISIGDRERYVKLLMFLCASVSFLGILLIILFILRESLPAILKVGPRELFFSAKWAPNVASPEKGHYGMLTFIKGTVITTACAMIIGAPLGIGTAIFIDQVAPARMSLVVRRGVELLAGIPSVIIGWFALTLLVPFIAWLTNSSGYGYLAATLVLSVMALPTITTLSAGTLKSLPIELKEASVAMGSTRWQTIHRVLLPAAREGFVIATILGMGRAIGETMAVQMVIGNSRLYSTLTSRIVTDMGESTGVFRSSLFAMALVLLLLSMVMIISIRLVSRERKI